MAGQSVSRSLPPWTPPRSRRSPGRTPARLTGHPRSRWQVLPESRALSPASMTGMAQPTPRRIRIGIDTGGTFTDVVALDERTGDAGHHQDAVHSGEPGRRLHGRRRQGPRPAGARTAATSSAVSHGTTVATNQLLEGKVGSPGLHHHRGLRVHARDRPAVGAGRLRQLLLLGEARPDRAGRPGPHRAAAGSTTTATSCARSTRPRPARSARWFRDRGVTTLGVCFLHAYANPDHERRMREILAAGAPGRRRVDLLRRAARVPRVRAVDDHPGRRRGQAHDGPLRRQHPAPAGRRGAGRAVLRDEVQRRRALGRRGGPPADHHRAVRSRGRRAGRRADRAPGRFRPGPHLRRRRHLHRRVRRPRRRAGADHRGHRRLVPQQDPDDRRGHGRGRRRVDRLDLPRGHPQGGPPLGRRRPRPAVLRQGRHRAHHHRRARGARPDPPAPARRGDPAGRRRRAGRPGPAGRHPRPRPRGVRHRDPRDLGVEPGQRAAPGHRQARPRRPRLHPDHVRRLRLAAAVPAHGHPRPGRRPRAAEPGQRLGVRPAHGRRQERLRAHRGRPARRPRPGPGRRRCTTTCTDQAAEALDREGFPRAEHRYARTADLRYVGQAFEVRVPVAGGPGRHRDGRRRGGRASTRRTSSCTATLPRRPAPAGGVGQPAGLRRRSDHPAGAVRAAPWRRRPGAGPHRRPPGASSTRYVDTPIYWRSDLAPGDVLHGPAVIEEFGSTVPVHPGFVARVDALGNLVVRKEPVQ